MVCYRPFNIQTEATSHLCVKGLYCQFPTNIVIIEDRRLLTFIRRRVPGLLSFVGETQSPSSALPLPFLVLSPLLSSENFIFLNLSSALSYDKELFSNFPITKFHKNTVKPCAAEGRPLGPQMGIHSGKSKSTLIAGLSQMGAHFSKQFFYCQIIY